MILHHLGSHVFIVLSFLIPLIIVITTTLNTTPLLPAEAQLQNPFMAPTVAPEIQDSNLKAELVYSGSGLPTNMAFIGPDDILLLSKNDGKVLRIKDGKNLGPVLEVNVTGKDEMGLLGIATEPYKNQKYPTKVFLY